MTQKKIISFTYNNSVILECRKQFNIPIHAIVMRYNVDLNLRMWVLMILLFHVRLPFIGILTILKYPV